MHRGRFKLRQTYLPDSQCYLAIYLKNSHTFQQISDVTTILSWGSRNVNTRQETCQSHAANTKESACGGLFTKSALKRTMLSREAPGMEMRDCAAGLHAGMPIPRHNQVLAPHTSPRPQIIKHERCPKHQKNGQHGILLGSFYRLDYRILRRRSTTKTSATRISFHSACFPPSPAHRKCRL